MTQSLIDVIAEAIGYVLASQVSGNNMPDMSGDPRNRLPPHKRERFNKGCSEAARDVIKAIDQAGYVVAPKEPTKPQVSAFLGNCKFSNFCCGCPIDEYEIGSWSDGVKAMLSASKEGITE